MNSLSEFVADRPDVLELLARVKDITPLISQHAGPSEAARRLAPEVVEALHAANLFGLWTAREVGGLDVDPTTQLEVLIALAHADMSTCWSLMIGATSAAIMASRVPEEGREAIFSQSRIPTAASSLRPSGTALRQDGGYLINGRWSYGSGILHAHWICANCLVDKNDDAEEGPLQIIAVIAIDQVEIEDDWHVPGLAGTGSCSYNVKDVFVPDHMIGSANPLVVLRGGAAAENLHLRLPLEHGAVALGGARRALDEVTQLAKSKRRLVETTTVADQQAFQIELGRLEARFECGLAGMRSVVAAFTQALARDADGQLLAAALTLRAVCAQVTEECQAIINRCLRYGGASAIMSGSLLERIQRDMTVAAQHYMISDAAYELLGKGRLD